MSEDDEYYYPPSLLRKTKKELIKLLDETESELIKTKNDLDYTKQLCRHIFELEGQEEAINNIRELVFRNGWLESDLEKV